MLALVIREYVRGILWKASQLHEIHVSFHVRKCRMHCIMKKHSLHNSICLQLGHHIWSTLLCFSTMFWLHSLFYKVGGKSHCILGQAIDMFTCPNKRSYVNSSNLHWAWSPLLGSVIKGSTWNDRLNMSFLPQVSKLVAVLLTDWLNHIYVLI